VIADDDRQHEDDQIEDDGIDACGHDGPSTPLRVISSA
jgi:hypothetical protein